MAEITVPYKMEKVGSNTTIFMFDKLFDYSDFIKQAEAGITTGNAKKILNDINSPNYVQRNIRSNGARVYGTNDASLVVNPFSTYLFNNELSQFIDGLRDKTVKSNIIDIDQKKKIQFTSQEFGIFSFDLASLGLIKVYSYFSHAMNDFVSPNLVKSRRKKDGKPEFYFIGLKGVERDRKSVV